MSIGYACMLAGAMDFSIKTCMLSSAGDDNLRNITKLNLEVLDRMIDYNIENNIKLFRISSDIIPFGSHPINQQAWWIEHKDSLDKIGKKIKKSGMRVSMHPGQYTVLNSPDPSIVINAIRDLNYHARFLNALNTDASNKIVLHIGGVYKDKEKFVKLLQNYDAGKSEITPIKTFLLKLAVKYDEKYIIESYYFSQNN